MAPSGHLFVTYIPADGPLGANEKDFSKVKTVKVDMEGNIKDDSVKAGFFASGKLGTIVGGFLNLEDFRAPLKRDDIEELAAATTRDRLERKRTLGNTYTLGKSQKDFEFKR